MTRTVELVSWNLHAPNATRGARLGELVARTGTPQIAFLQEVTTPGRDAFRELAGFDWLTTVDDAFHSLLVTRGRAGPDRPRVPRGVGFAGKDLEVTSLTAFPDVPLPEKVMAGWCEIGGRAVTLLTYHAPTGVQHKLKKPAQAVQIANWLATIDGPAIMAGDFNTPKLDTPDWSRIRTHWHTGDRKLGGLPGDDLLVGPSPIHHLRDALRSSLDSKPRKLSRLRRDAPNGPLTTSHVTGSKRTPRRYDAIWLSPHFVVESIEYLYEDALGSGSDHALVRATISLRSRRGDNERIA